MFTPTLRCECAQPGLIDTMRKWSIPQWYLLIQPHSPEPFLSMDENRGKMFLMTVIH